MSTTLPPVRQPTLRDVAKEAGVPFLMPEAMNDRASPRSMAWLRAVAERPATRAVMAMRPPRQ